MKVAIIGAGASGLCAARHFSRFPEKFQRIQVFEQTSEVGGTWVYTDDTDTDEMGLPIHSSMYKNMRTNLPKEVMAFPDFPFKPNHPHHSYIYHWEVLQYLQQYAAHYQLSRFIKFKTLVEQVAPSIGNSSTSKLEHANNAEAVVVGEMASGDGTGTETASGGGFRNKVDWLVTTRDLLSGQQTTERYDAVLVCNGHYFKPDFPTDIPGLDTFPGTILHSHRYRVPSCFRNQRVLVVGAGPSGTDITVDIASDADTVYLCNRHTWITCELPENVEQVPAVEAVRKDGTVCFANKVQRKVDSILLCTGYHFEFPFLSKEADIRVANKRIVRLYKHTFNATYPSMAFLGVNLTIDPFPLFNLQALWVLAVWAGNKALPSSEKMVVDSDEDYRERLERGFPPHHAHYLGALQWEFQKELAELGGSEPYPPVLQKLYEERYRARCESLCHYKDLSYVLVSRDEWSFATKDD